MAPATDENNEKPKLYYYKATGRGNMIRLALAASGVEWEDVCAAGFPPTAEEVAEWRRLGGNTTTNVPMLVTPDGRVYVQSLAVMRAVGRSMGGGKLLPKSLSDDDAYAVDKLLADAEDLRVAAYKSFVIWPGVTQEDADKFVSEIMPNHLANLERQLPDGKDYFVGDALTLADVAVYDAVASFCVGRLPDEERTKILNDLCPKLRDWMVRVEADPGIAKYHQSEQWKSLMKFDKSTLGY